ncbi:hypothetical protein J2Z21_008684 [Streptomyces griseochromogenes]|uniref:Uncharacterized protein n=1 Tax=Streptomyces griseochromogenes TaxID=68214 RepID=A0ABS4M7P6_9ACTN|nr:hypothetical protein [Streptomyces griseochromogenes]
MVMSAEVPEDVAGGVTVLKVDGRHLIITGRPSVSTMAPEAPGRFL